MPRWWKLVDTTVSNAVAERRVGSSPTMGTKQADMLELVDKPGRDPGASNSVGVQVPLSAPNKRLTLGLPDSILNTLRDIH